jgi:hypothetical protein
MIESYLWIMFFPFALFNHVIGSISVTLADILLISVVLHMLAWYVTHFALKNQDLRPNLSNLQATGLNCTDLTSCRTTHAIYC